MGSIFPKKVSRRKMLAGNEHHNDDDDDDNNNNETTVQLLAELRERDPRKELALKAGFVSLQERLGNWTRQTSVSPTIEARDRSKLAQTVEASNEQQCHQHHHQTAQFATLQEFFQSKSSLRKQLEQDELLREQKRPRVPIMKLTKEDWNVKCWEERFRKGGPTFVQASKENNNNNNNNNSNSASSAAGAVQPNRAKKLERQVEVFHGRIDEVAKKLDKVREGAPMDEQLYKLKGNKLRESKREHTWTDLLKSELTEGVHNPKLLKSKLQTKLSDTAQDDGDSVSIKTTATTTTTATTAAARRPLVKSPLGRPIGRSDQDDDDDEGS